MAADTANPPFARLGGKKRFLILPLDLLLVGTAFHLAGAFRFDGFNPASWGPSFPGWPEYLRILGLVLLTKGTLFTVVGLYRSLWAYASLHDLFSILKATLAATVAAVVVLLMYNRLAGISRSVLILDGILLFLFLCFRSFSWRIFRDILYVRFTHHGRRTLLIGAGLGANRLIAEFRADPAHERVVVGILDTDRDKVGASLQGVPVLGTLERLRGCLDELRADEVIITLELAGTRVRDTYRTCEEMGIHCRRLPPLGELLSRPEIGRAVRDISLEDLLGREVVRLETENIFKALHNRTILISGAGGSIGSEVCRQLLRYRPAAMILLDNAETPLYEIDHEVRNVRGDGEPRPQVVSVIGDVRDQAQMTRILAEHDVHTIFHCAAYKHVPMMELNPAQAVLNNVIGTVVLSTAARDAGVERFVMISTDKAVNPVNIMGATKRIAEIYIQNLSRLADTKFITVRFGNVLGSNGSVIPLFSKQIAAGGPVTVTHPEIIRYFMTIEEAAGLVIEAGVIGKGGEIFILDMGEPVKIKDMAEDMIRFAGLVPHQDIEIRYVGLRPGEKLFEELLLEGEGIQPTHHKKIHIAMSRNVNLADFLERIHELRRASEGDDRASVDEIIARILPEYRPVYSLSARSPKEQQSKSKTSDEIEGRSSKHS